MIREAAERTGDAVGDGTTTATLLAHAIFAEGLRNVAAGASADRPEARPRPRRCAAAVAALRELSRPVASRQEKAQVATISAHNDPTIGELVADAMEKVGDEGVITVEEAKGTETALEVVEGMQFDRGYLSPYFVTDPEKMEAVLEDAAASCSPTSKIGRDEGPASRCWSRWRRRAGRCWSWPRTSRARRWRRWWSTSCAACSPARRSRRPASATAARRCCEDIAILTGGQVIAEELGVKLENVDARASSARPSGWWSTRRTPRSSAAPATRRRHRGPLRASSARRSRRPPATTTGRSSRSGWRSSPAAWR